MNPILDEKFRYAFNYIIINEGTTFTDDPDDRGGATKFGITQRSLSHYMKQEATQFDVENLEIDDAMAFYFSTYYVPMRLPEVKNQAVAAALLDASINQGQGTAVKLAQRLLKLSDDGVIGLNTINALNACDPEAFVQQFHNVVLDHYQKIVEAHPEQSKFIHGWTNRANRLLTLIA